MHATPKVFLVLIVGSFASTLRSEIVWEQTQLELHPALGDETAIGHFKYQNKGDKPIAIKSVTTSCGCTAASAKQSAGPGEAGEVTATFKIGDRIGLQQKAITVTTDDPAHPSTTLTLKVAIPQVLELQPAFVYWQAGEAVKAKTIVAKAGKDVSIKNLNVSSSSPEFLAKVEPGPSPGEFRINVEPRQTAQPVAATLTIKPELSDGKLKVFYATASITRPASAATPSTIPAIPSPPNQPAQLPTAATAESNKSKIDACALLTGKEIQLVQGERLRDTKPSGKSAGGFVISQCYFTMPTLSDSISLTLVQKGDGADARDPKQHWKEIFDHDKGTQTGKEEEREKSAAPEKIAGVGDEAFWAGNRFGGELYVLKGNNYIRISVGGAGDQASKVKKSKELAEQALKRL